MCVFNQLMGDDYSVSALELQKSDMIYICV